MAGARLNKAHICGPGLSICCSVISIWGIIMLVSQRFFLLSIMVYFLIIWYCHLKAIVGGLLSAKSAAFIEDIPIEEHGEGSFEKAVDKAYEHSAINCYGAAGLYVVILMFCLIQVWFNIKVAAQKK
jgi:ribonuclease kappa